MHQQEEDKICIAFYYFQRALSEVQVYELEPSFAIQWGKTPFLLHLPVRICSFEQTKLKTNQNMWLLLKIYMFYIPQSTVVQANGCHWEGAIRNESLRKYLAQGSVKATRNSSLRHTTLIKQWRGGQEKVLNKEQRFKVYIKMTIYDEPVTWDN